MTFRRWTSALFACPAKLLLSVVAAATVGLFGQRADASRTPIDTSPAALASAILDGQTAANVAGRVTTRTVAGRNYTYAYDAYGRLLSYTDSTDSGNNASYAYDAYGNRVGMTVGSTHRRMVYENGDVIAEYVDDGNDGSVNRLRLYWILPDIDQRIGFVDMAGGATNLYFYLTDHIGSVLQIVDESGAVVNQYDYDAFGNIRWENSFEGVENRYTFQGREWDAHAGHYYFRNRTYVPEWGGFSGPDMNLALGVAGEPNGLMSYLAFDNDPAGKVDPLGLEFGDWWDYRTHAFIAGGFCGGLRGGASVTVSTLTFGGADKIGLTDSDQYQGGAYTVSRVSSVIAREALITVGTMGSAQIARGGVESARAMTYSGRAINYVAQSRTAVKAAQTVTQGAILWDVGSGSYSVGAGISKVVGGDDWGYLDIAAGGLRVTGGFLGAREMKRTLPIEGGRHGDIRTETGRVRVGHQRHHTPAKAINGMRPSDGPAVLLESTVHQETASWGRRSGSIPYRAMQAEFIQNGRFDDAVRADIIDIRSIAGHKYNLGINQMLDYVEALE